MDSTIGKKIKQLRKELKMTQSELAEPEMTKGMLSHIENGHANPSMKNLQYIAHKLNKPLSYFFQDSTLNKENVIEENQLPIDEILNRLKIIDDLFNKKEFELAKKKIRQVLEVYDFHKNSKLYADIVYRLGSCCIKLNEFKDGETFIHTCCEIYENNMLYVNATRAYMRLIEEPLKKYEYNKCVKVLDKVYEIYEKSSSKDIFLEIQILLMQPAVYFAKGDFEKTIEVCEKAISMSNENNIYYLLDDAYRIMGITYLFKDDYTKFTENMKKSEKYLEFTENKFNLIKIYHNYAKYENMINNPSEALKYLSLFENITEEKTFYYYLEHGKAEYLLGNYDKALQDLCKISSDVKIIHLYDCIYILTAKIYKGLVYGKLKNFDKAIKELEDAIKQIEAYTNIEYMGSVTYAYKQLSFAYESLSEVYSLKGDYEQAYVLLKKSNEIKILAKK